MTKQTMQNKEQTRDMEVRRYTPAVDIFETEQQLVLQAEVPGISEQDLQIEVERGILTLEALQAEVAGEARKSWYRQFRISEKVDVDAGSAELKDGVLTLRLPKVAAAQPKKIAVKTLH